MNELYDKILEYIRLYGIKQSLDSDSNFKSKMQEDIAKDISEICIAYYEEKFFEFVRRTDELEKENSRLIVLVDRLDRENAVKLAARNGRIMDLEIQVKDLTEVNEDLQTRLESYSKVIKSLEDTLKAVYKSEY